LEYALEALCARLALLQLPFTLGAYDLIAVRTTLQYKVVVLYIPSGPVHHRLHLAISIADETGGACNTIVVVRIENVLQLRVAFNAFLLV